LLLEFVLLESVPPQVSLEETVKYSAGQAAELEPESGLE
jgi:hypothetical protein